MNYRGKVNPIGFCTNDLGKPQALRVLEILVKLNQLKVMSNFSLMHLHLDLSWFGNTEEKLLKQCHIETAGYVKHCHLFVATKNPQE